MHARQSIPEAISRLAVHQAGVVTREQALALGLSRHVLHRLTRDETWAVICRGVFATAGTDWAALAWGGVLVGGEGARLGGAAAAFAGGLIDQAPDSLEIWIPFGSDPPARQPTSACWRFRRESPGVRGPATGSPPRTRIEDTVLDLAASGDEAETVSWVAACVQRRLTTPRRLLAAMDSRQGCRHRRLIRSLLADVAAGAESPLEIDYLRRVERAHGLPRARRQARQRGTVIDVLYEEFGLVVELDGRVGHQGSGRFRDMCRDNRAAEAGLATLRYGWSDVHGQPCAVAAQVAEVLMLRGWIGPFESCRQCQTFRLGSLTA